MKEEIKIGDIVRIVDIGDKDAYFNNKEEIIGEIHRITFISNTTSKGNWIGIHTDIISNPKYSDGCREIDRKDCFFRVKVRKLEEKEIVMWLI